MTHPGTKKHECPFCKKTFLRPSICNQHVLIHTGKKPYICKTCGKCFRQKSYLNQHHLTHSGEKPHKCSICSASFCKKSNLNSHQQTHSNPSFHLCPNCPRKFAYKSSLRQHVKTHLSSFRKPAFECIFCGRSLTTYVGYSQHLLAHVGEARVFCELCDKEFSNTGHKNRHIRQSHTLERPHGCKMCDNRFLTKTDLKQHSTVHLPKDELRRFNCIFCGKGFHRKSVLFEHLRSHLREK